MKIAVYKTGHEIADKVAESLTKGLTDGITPRLSIFLPNRHSTECPIGYGILRGMAEVYRASQETTGYFQLDRGYWKPNHFDGYYRVSYRGTQATSNWIAPDYERLDRLKLDIKPWRGFDDSKPVLLCPPTEAVCDFFRLNYLSGVDYCLEMGTKINTVVRRKGDTSPINFNDYNYVHTFNSSVGWQALAAGIPCVSDTTHSMVGSWFNNISLDQLADKQLQERHRLFATMAASQFTLQEIEQGKAWGLLSHCLYGSALTVEKPLPVKSPPTASSAGLRHHFQSTT